MVVMMCCFVKKVENFQNNPSSCWAEVNIFLKNEV